MAFEIILFSRHHQVKEGSLFAEYDDNYANKFLKNGLPLHEDLFKFQKNLQQKYQY